MIAQKIFGWARKKPDHPALIDEDVPTTYAQLARMVEAACANLARQNLPADQIALVLASTALEQWTLVLALRELGIDTLQVSGAKMASDLALQNVSAIAAPERLVPTLEKNPDIAGIRIIAVAQTALAPVMTGPLPEPRPAPKVGGFLAVTSGTTGRYKKIFLSSTREEQAMRWFVEAFAINEKTVFHAYNFPLWTLVGAGLSPSVWFAGGTVIASRGQGFKGFFRHRPNMTLLTPVMVANLVDEVGEIGTPCFPDFELDVAGGFLPLSLARRVVTNITPKINVLYGSTEVTGLMCSRFHSADDLHWLSENNTNYEIVDDMGEPVPTGTEGELRLKLRPYDAKGYLDDEAATAKFFRNGYFYPGDLAVRREDRRIRVLGRVDDVINLRGFKAPSAPVEDLIQRRLRADTVCVFSETGDEGENQVIVAIESALSFTRAQLAASVQGRLGFEAARFVVLKEFPRTEMGTRKVNRRALRRLVT